MQNRADAQLNSDTKINSIIRYMQDFVRDNGYPPSVREIGSAMNMKSTATVHYYLKKMEERGVIRRSANQNRCIELLSPYDIGAGKGTVNIPLIGKIAAGTPITAIQNYEDTYPLPSQIFPYNDSEVFMLKVAGDSMIDIGIYNGDNVIIKVQECCDNGDIIAALVDDEATLKRFYNEGDHIRLKPENSTMQDIIVKDVKILGIAVGLLRRF